MPVADIYHLLMERRGHFEAAKQDVIRWSQQPPTSSHTRRPFESGRATTVPITVATNTQGVVEDEPYIKIDFDNPDFIFDKDAPESFSEPSRRKRQSQVRPKNAKKPTAKPLKRTISAVQTSRTPTRLRSPSYCVPRSPYTPTKSPARTPEVGPKPRKGQAVKSSKSKVVGDINRGLRETSYDRSFIVPDEETLNSDEHFSESDEADIDMTDDGTDLTIDMQPEFAYNSDVLPSPVSR